MSWLHALGVMGQYLNFQVTHCCPLPQIFRGER